MGSLLLPVYGTHILQVTPLTKLIDQTMCCSLCQGFPHLPAWAGGRESSALLAWKVHPHVPTSPPPVLLPDTYLSACKLSGLWHTLPSQHPATLLLFLRSYFRSVVTMWGKGNGAETTSDFNFCSWCRARCQAPATCRVRAYGMGRRYKTWGHRLVPTSNFPS